MKIFYSTVERQNFKIKLSVFDDGFLVEQARIETKTNEDGSSSLVVMDYDESLSCRIKFDDITARSDFSDHAAYNLPEAGHAQALFNFWAATKPARETGFDFSRRAGFNSTISLVIPFKDSPVTDWVLGVHVRGEEFFELVNTTASEHPTDAVGGLGSLREIASPSVVFDESQATCLPDGTVTLAFKVLNPDGSMHAGTAEAYFEATGGYLPVSRVTVNGGSGTLNVAATGVQSGQSFKVKSGFKYYSGQSECKITVQ